MRVMVHMKGDPKPGQLPSEELLEAMTRFNEELHKAGVMLEGEGLHPSSEAKRVSYQGGKITVTDGPFAEAKEVVAGYWVWQVRDMDEAVEWAKRIPWSAARPEDYDESGEGHVDIRPIFELDEFAEAMPDSPAIARAKELDQNISKKG